MRKILAIIMAKLAIVAGRLLGKLSSSTPGAIALKICPDIIKILSRNIEKGIIVCCGTNGKTTTNNLLNTTLIKLGYSTICNTMGANMLSGVATAFIEKSNLLGTNKTDYAVLEVDEAFARKVFAHLTPTCMVVTNLFRDQLDRYGEIDITLSLLKDAINMAPNVNLILNGDDPISSQLGKDKKAYYFGISELVLPQTDDTKEGRYCANCGSEQSYTYIHYNQLGDYYCLNCGNKRPNIDFNVKNVDLSESMKFSINNQQIDVNYRGFYNIYNILAVYSTISVLGIKTDNFNQILSDYKPQVGRMELINLGKPFILNLAKNPAGFNQAIQTVMLDKRKKDIIIAVNDCESDGRDISWLWDVDFDRLKDDSVNKITLSGARRYDLGLRFKYADIKIDLITHNMREALENNLNTNAEVCYVLVNYTVLFGTQSTMLDIQKKLKEGGNENV